MLRKASAGLQVAGQNAAVDQEVWSVVVASNGLTGGDFDPHRIVETVRMLVNEQRYRQEREFEFLQDPERLQYQAGVKLQVGNRQPLYARFDPVEDRMEKCHGDQVPLRVRIRTVLSLLFGAELEPNILKFDIRKHISFALTDARMKRYFIHNKTIPLPEEDDKLPCILVRPGVSVSIVAVNDLGPTTLVYDIYISQDPAEFPFRWVDMNLDLFEEVKGLAGDQIFGGRLKLRDFGRSGAKTTMGQSIEWIVTQGDPREAEAYARLETYSKLADRLLQKGNRTGAREQYEKFLEKHSGSLAAHEARARYDILK